MKAYIQRLATLPAEGVELVRASDLKMSATDWLWPQWLAAGKLHILAGPPGTGKTTIASAIGSVVSNGGKWPDGTLCRRPGHVLVWSGEDDPADTLVPRFLAAGAMLDRIHFVSESRLSGLATPFDPARDMALLERTALELGNVRLLIVDPIVSAVAGDAHRNNEVRRSLAPVVDFAHATGAAVIGITHFNKGGIGADPLGRVNGSIAYGALARLVWGVAKRESNGDSEGQRVMVRVKSNLGPDDGGFGYHIDYAELGGGVVGSRIVWGAPLSGSAREILGDAEAVDQDTGEALTDAKAFVADLLRNGPAPTKGIQADASGAGYSWATIKRALNAVGAKPSKESMRGGWVWSIPEVAQQKSLSNFEENEQLRAISADTNWSDLPKSLKTFEVAQVPALSNFEYQGEDAAGGPTETVAFV